MFYISTRKDQIRLTADKLFMILSS
jgi:hypothetical protein